MLDGRLAPPDSPAGQTVDGSMVRRWFRAGSRRSPTLPPGRRLRGRRAPRCAQRGPADVADGYADSRCAHRRAMRACQQAARPSPPRRSVLSRRASVYTKTVRESGGRADRCQAILPPSWRFRSAGHRRPQPRRAGQRSKQESQRDHSLVRLAAHRVHLASTPTGLVEFAWPHSLGRSPAGHAVSNRQRTFEGKRG
jgi:hypothetical protein